MDYPATTAVPKLKAGETLEFPLKASFNNRILEIDEDTGVQAEIAVNFIRDGRNDVISVTQPMTIYGKNAIVWGQSNMVGSFVTPKDDTLRDFVRTAINENRPKADAIEKSLLTAMTLFDVFTADGIKYVADPNSPYSSVTENSVDYVQFGRETLKLKSGDCDDLSVLMSASLENLGLETAILDVPGHLLMMFNTGVPEAQRELISLDDDLMVVRDGNIWIPVEATMIGTSFAEAWAEGARKYHEYDGKHQLTVIPLQQAWAEFKPVTLKPATYTLQAPDTARVSPLVQREKNLLLEKSLERLVRPYRAMAQMSPNNMKARMQVAIIYARYGLEDSAEREFDAILQVDPDNSAVQNNRGNVFFNRGDYERALENYSYAEKLASNDAGIKMNMSMAYYKEGNLRRASAKYEEAAMIDAGVNTKYGGFVKLLSK
jgi:tetratricopeptide (TPR) repeat protein